ncbi:MAG: CgeB family protein [Candidatus Cyclobacteriaceae bacterium M2_1C_046]
MNIKLFYHSLISDWNHGNAHFLRGITAELIKLGHQVTVYEPQDGWSYQNLKKDKGQQAIDAFTDHFPHLKSEFYDDKNFDPHTFLHDADMVLVHEWNEPDVVNAISAYSIDRDDMVALFHDTHHRSITAPQEMEKYDLTGYNGVLAFGDVVSEIYRKNGWAKHAFTWHEAADTNIYHPMVREQEEGDLVWIGNWGDGERTDELHEFIIEPVKKLGLKATFYGVRYPEEAKKALADAGIEYRGWLPTHLVPFVFSRYKFTVHVPRKPYVEALPGIPTIRPFEAMACKIPLISAPWNDSEHLFTKGKDYVEARDGREMMELMKIMKNNPETRRNIAENGLATIHRHHTCAHRVQQLMSIYEGLKEREQSIKILI